MYYLSIGTEYECKSYMKLLLPNYHICLRAFVWLSLSSDPSEMCNLNDDLAVYAA